MTALELKKKYFKSRALHKVIVLGHLSACVEGQDDYWYCINDNEVIPHNVGLSFKISEIYQDHWRDEKALSAGVGLNVPAF